MSEELYAYGKRCTWHGPTTFASLIADGGEDDLICPFCGLELQVTTVFAFWQKVRCADAAQPGAEAMWRWSEGKCFPDFETMQNAYRQAMEQ